MTEQAIDKRRIADSFGRAAETYDQAAAFQRTVGGNLLARLPVDFHPADTTDLGCGTGYFTRALRQRYGQPVLGIDLADTAHRRQAVGGLGAFISAHGQPPGRRGPRLLLRRVWPVSGLVLPSVVQSPVYQVVCRGAVPAARQ